MSAIYALTILLVLFAVSEFIASKTKAMLSTVLTLSILLVVGFTTKLLPETLFEDAAVLKFGTVVVGILITSMGTTIDFQSLKEQWKVVAIALLGLIGSTALFIIAGQLFSLQKYALAGAPIFAGGNAATLLIVSQLEKLNLQEIIPFCVMLLVFQKFVGIPIASYFLKKEAHSLIKNGGAHHLVDESVKAVKEPIFKKYFTVSRPSYSLAKLALTASLSFFIANLLDNKIHYFVICLILGALFLYLGILSKNELSQTGSETIILFLATIVIFSNLTTISISQLVELIVPLSLLFVSGVIGIFIVSYISSLIFKVNFSLCVALSITCTFGFPTTMLLSKEVAEAVGGDQEKRAMVEDYLLPKMLVAGFVTVTIASVLLAGVLVQFI